MEDFTYIISNINVYIKDLPKTIQHNIKFQLQKDLKKVNEIFKDNKINCENCKYFLNDGYCKNKEITEYYRTCEFEVSYFADRGCEWFSKKGKK